VLHPPFGSEVTTTALVQLLDTGGGVGVGVVVPVGVDLTSAKIISLADWVPVFAGL
jgi:hypothetical protein